MENTPDVIRTRDLRFTAILAVYGGVRKHAGANPTSSPSPDDVSLNEITGDDQEIDSAHVDIKFDPPPDCRHLPPTLRCTVFCVDAWICI